MGFNMDELLEDYAEWEEAVIKGTIITPCACNRKRISACLELGMGNGEQLLVGWALENSENVLKLIVIMLFNFKEIKITN